MSDQTAPGKETQLLTPAAFYIIMALSDKERHGYGIMQEVTRLTNGSTHLGPGTLYRTIKKMVADGLISQSDERPDPDLDDERRKYYKLTGLGERVGRAEAERLSSLAKVAESKWHLGVNPVIEGGV